MEIKDIKSLKLGDLITENPSNPTIGGFSFVGEVLCVKEICNKKYDSKYLLNKAGESKDLQEYVREIIDLQERGLNGYVVMEYNNSLFSISILGLFEHYLKIDN